MNRDTRIVLLLIALLGVFRALLNRCPVEPDNRATITEMKAPGKFEYATLEPSITCDPDDQLWLTPHGLLIIRKDGTRIAYRIHENPDGTWVYRLSSTLNP